MIIFENSLQKVLWHCDFLAKKIKQKSTGRHSHCNTVHRNVDDLFQAERSHEIFWWWGRKTAHEWFSAGVAAWWWRHFWPPSAVIRVRRFRNCCDNLVDPSWTRRPGRSKNIWGIKGMFCAVISDSRKIPNKQPTNSKKMGLVYYTYILIYISPLYIQNVGKYSGRTQILWVPHPMF